MRLLLPLLFLVTFSSYVDALEFTRLGGTFSMHGEIKEGDSAKFLVELASWESPPTIFHISSKGGDLVEAMTIGEIVRESQIPVWSGEECLSACVFVLIAGVERSVMGTIGFHRPYFDRSYFASLSLSEADKKYSELWEKSKAYLYTMGASQEVVDKILATRSSKIELLSQSKAAKLFAYRLPFYEEWLAAKCGSYTEEQSRVLRSLSALEAARATLTIAKQQDIPKTDEFGSNFAELRDDAQLAMQMEKAGMLEPYRELAKIHQECEEKAVNRHVFAFHRGIQEYVRKLATERKPNKKMPPTQ